jgi:hypothetical protein
MRRRRRNRGRRGSRSSFEQLCDGLAATAQRAKTRLCQFCAGPIDGLAMLVYRLDGTDELFITPLPPGHPVDTFPLVLERILDEGLPDFVAVIAESYVGTHFDEHSYKHGQFERDFKENPTSDVTEALLIAGVDIRQGRHRNTAIPFVYDDGGMPRFTRHPWDDGCDGNLGEILEACVRDVQRRAGW